MAVAKIIVIDDSELVLKVTASKLKLAGYEVVTASNQKSLIEIAREKPNLVLLDVEMPGMGGDRIATLLQETGLLSQGLVVFYSGRPAFELEDLVQRTGVSGYVRKDLETGEFLEQIRFWVGEAKVRFGRS